MTERYGLIKENISLIRARIDTSTYKPSAVPPEFISRHSLPRDGKKIVMAVRLQYPKRAVLDTLFRVAEQQAAAGYTMHFIIAGEGALQSEYEARAAAINRRSTRGPVVHLIGPLFQVHELNLLYNYADVVLGNGRGILEAMACRKPVIILGRDGRGDLVGEHNIEDIAVYNFSERYFDHAGRSRVELADALGRVLKDDENLQAAGAFCHTYISNNMDARIGGRQLVEVYQRVCGVPPAVSEYAAWYLKTAADGLKRAIRNRLPH